MSQGNYIPAKVQDALRAFLRAQVFDSIPPENIYKGIENPTARSDEPQELIRQDPCIVCVCQMADPAVRDGITYDATATVLVRTNADDTTDDEHHTIASAVFNLLTTTTVAADLSAALADFTVHYVSPGPVSWRLNGRAWEAVLVIQILCCGSDIS